MDYLHIKKRGPKKKKNGMGVGEEEPIKKKKKNLHIPTDKPWFNCYISFYAELKEIFWKLSSTHSHLETCKSVIGKQCRPRSDATLCGI